MTELPTYRLLLIEDNPGDAELAGEWLADLVDFRLEMSQVTTLAAAVAAVADGGFDGAVLDLNLPDSTGLATLERLLAASPDLPVIVYSGMSADPDLGLAAETAGAADVLSKEDTSSRLFAHSVRSVLRRASADRLHRQFERLLTQVPDAVILTDRGGTVRFVNPAAEGLFAVAAGELIGRRLGIALEDGATAAVPAHGDGGPRFAEMRVVDCSWDRRPARLAMLRDVTDGRMMAEQLRQSQKMEALGLLAGGIAHDFNNLLLVILLYIDAIRRSPGAEAIATEVSEIAQAIERARAMTRQLLTFSRRQPAEFEVLGLGEVVTGVRGLLRRTLPETIALDCVVGDGPSPVLADRGQIEQVLMNFAINARDAMPAGGVFRVEVADVAVVPPGFTLPPGEHVMLRVSDTGTGIAPADLPRIFEPFFTTKARGKGTGLGLANCYAIITQARGQIRAESTPGAGTTFTILLPRSEAQPGEDVADPPAPASGGGSGTILVVEDDPAVARATGLILEKSGYRVRAAGDGEEARRLLTAQPAAFDLVLTDVVMPNMGGPELAGFIAGHRPDLPVVFMTGYTDHPIVALEGATTIDGHPALLKPFQPHDLLRLVREGLAGRA
ncbi:hybrid sensor histidine kinase/response regulator [Methylobrevis pamukkalensis]|uniref:histidine kinase n=1 Tax=Methylobrevis pamukkalensis TaxID=1439726 RepID=A0A1E3H0C9_9HYPH|nr:response regulator [Methylobrevis pamukkalensis]ODN69769.1 Blue-light-activated protein [Methylobrevis pamukkalensis]